MPCETGHPNRFLLVGRNSIGLLPLCLLLFEAAILVCRSLQSRSLQSQLGAVGGATFLHAPCVTFRRPAMGSEETARPGSEKGFFLGSRLGFFRPVWKISEPGPRRFPAGSLELIQATSEISWAAAQKRSEPGAEKPSGRPGRIPSRVPFWRISPNGVAKSRNLLLPAARNLTSPPEERYTG